jgi:hypothetical protein
MLVVRSLRVALGLSLIVNALGDQDHVGETSSLRVGSFNESVTALRNAR